MKRVLVTGACGNIGANVVDLLVEQGYEVRAVDLDNKKNRETATRWGDQVDTRFGSICSEPLVADLVSGMDHVIHLAAVVPPGTDVDQAIGYAVNVVGTRSIVAACEAQLQPPRLTFTSTAAIWGRNDEVEGPRRAAKRSLRAIATRARRRSAKPCFGSRASTPSSFVSR